MSAPTIAYIGERSHLQFLTSKYRLAHAAIAENPVATIVCPNDFTIAHDHAPLPRNCHKSVREAPLLFRSWRGYTKMSPERKPIDFITHDKIEEELTMLNYTSV